MPAYGTVEYFKEALGDQDTNWFDSLTWFLYERKYTWDECSKYAHTFVAYWNEFVPLVRDHGEDIDDADVGISYAQLCVKKTKSHATLVDHYDMTTDDFIIIPRDIDFVIFSKTPPANPILLKLADGLNLIEIPNITLFDVAYVDY